MLVKIKSFFLKLIPSKRRIIQLYAALLYNANIKGFVSGEIFKGVSKAVCLPGLNCYSCPGAIGACPLGSIQNALAASKTKLPTYILGIILLYSIILGRTICGFLCPVGLLQELLYKIKSPKLKKSKVTRILSYFKYVILVVLVILIPLIYGLQSKNIPLPGFCKYICPAGTFEGAIFLLANPYNENFFPMLGSLFTWKFILLIIFIVCCVFIYRFFCRFFCPLGAIYGLFNKISILGVKVDKSKCTSCQACITNCKMDVKEVGDHECIQCGECRKVCHCNAISWKTIHKFVKDDLAKEEKENSNNLNNVDSETNEFVLTKKFKKIETKTFNRLVSGIMTVILIVTLCVVNLSKQPLEINEVCEKLTFKLNDDSVFDITLDNKPTWLYFYEELTLEEAKMIKNYYVDNINVILLAKKDVDLSKEVSDELEGCNILFVKKEKKRILSNFVKGNKYPYSVFLDVNDKVLIKNEGLISGDDYVNIVTPIISGKTVGYEVGNICYNKNINLVNSEDVFSIAKNRGKIIVINFWFTTCTPCVLELPFFNKVQENNKEDVIVIAIHEAEQYKEQECLDYMKNHFAGFSILFGYDDKTNPYYTMLGGKGAFPTTVIIDQSGYVAYVQPGSLTEEELQNEIDKLLK